MDNQQPALYAIQYSEFDINKGAYIYHEVGVMRKLKEKSIENFRQHRRSLVKNNDFIVLEISFVLNRV